MTFNPQQAKEDNDRINELLKQEAEYGPILKLVSSIKFLEKEIFEGQAEIGKAKEYIDIHRADIAFFKDRILDALLTLEAKTGYSKAPDLAHLTTTPESYEVTDESAVPEEFIKIETIRKIDKKALNAAIKEGKVDRQSNWLKINPSKKTVVLA